MGNLTYDEYAELRGRDVRKECAELVAILKTSGEWMSLSEIARAVMIHNITRSTQGVALAIMAWQGVIEGRGAGRVQGHYTEYRCIPNSESRLEEIFRGENIVRVGETPLEVGVITDAIESKSS